MQITHALSWTGRWIALPLLVVLLWDISPADRIVAYWYGTASGFSLADNYWLSRILHTRLRQCVVLFAACLVLAIWWPVGPLRRCTKRQRVWLASMVWLCAGGIALLKSTSLTSCPSQLKEFGGVARYVWHLYQGSDGGSGRCFPSGHASTFFSFLPVFWVLRLHHPQRAWQVLAGLVLLGLALSWVQVVRGEHYPSHLLWTAWLCWAASALASPLLGKARASVHASAQRG